MKPSQGPRSGIRKFAHESFFGDFRGLTTIIYKYSRSCHVSAVPSGKVAAQGISDMAGLIVVLWTCDYHNLDSPMQLQSGVPRSQLVGLEMMWSGHCPHINTVYPPVFFCNFSIFFFTSASIYLLFFLLSMYLSIHLSVQQFV